MSTIIEKIVASNAILNGRKNVNHHIKKTAKKDLRYAVNLLMKGYCLDDDVKKLMLQYQHIDKIPDAKVHAGKEITANRMQELMELVYPKVPHGHLVMVMVQKFGDELANYISNGEREDMIKALRSLADKLEGGKTIPMPTQN